MGAWTHRDTGRYPDICGLCKAPAEGYYTERGWYFGLCRACLVKKEVKVVPLPKRV